MELEGTIKSITFKPKGKENEVVASITIECQPNELEAGTLSRFAGKDVVVEISSYQLDLPLKEREKTAEVASESG